MGNHIPTPDFESYSMDNPVVTASNGDGFVRVAWADGTEGRFHYIWLRDNCASPECIDPDSHERTYDLPAIPTDVHPVSVAVTGEGALRVVWSDDDHESVYHPGWLRRFCYSDADNRPVEYAHETWNSALAERMPVFDGPAVLADDDARYDYLHAVIRYGIALLRDVPTDLETFETLARKVAYIIRDMNWGKFYDVISEPHGQYIANKAIDIPPHADAPTREYFPGLMIFQCIDNSVQGGESYWVDGFHIANIMRDRYPDDYALLTTVPWELANRARETHYRWTAPVIVTDANGNPTEVRDIHWLREPLMAEFELVPPVYAAYRRYKQLTNDPANQIGVKLVAGDLAVFDNRRVLHARRGFDPTTGHRHMRIAYAEREELLSNIRMIERARRAQ